MNVNKLIWGESDFFTIFVVTFGIFLADDRSKGNRGRDDQPFLSILLFRSV
jgi:hypothetical protein